MRFKEITESTVAGGIAPVESAGFVKMKSRPPTVYGDTTPQELTKKKKSSKYANSISEGTQVAEADLHEEDKILAPGKGSKLKTGLHGKSEEPKFKNFVPPFKSEGLYVSDKRGKSVCECSEQSLAPLIAKALNAYVATNESVEEGAKVDRMVKHIEKSERKLGKSEDEAENIAWATANKRGMLDNKNKKKGK